MLDKDIFSFLLPMCKANYEIITKVFSNPEQVMAKFVLNIYQLKIQEFIAGKISEKLESYNDLKVLYDFYSK